MKKINLICMSFCFAFVLFISVSEVSFAASNDESYKLWYPNYKVINTLNDVPTNKKFTISFSNDVNGQTISNTNIELVDSVLNKKVPVNITLISSQKVQVVPVNALDAGKNYYLLVHNGVKNTFGGSLDQGTLAFVKVKKADSNVIVYVEKKPMSLTVDQQLFISKIVNGASVGYDKYKVFPSVTIAQAILESGWGKSDISIKCNNFFGVKAGLDWTGLKFELTTSEWINGVKVNGISTYWRAYGSIDESIDDHGKFLAYRSWYANAGVFIAKNYAEQIIAIKRAGYA